MSPSILRHRFFAGTLLLCIYCLGANAVSLHRIPLVEDLLLTVAARDRLQQDLMQLDLRGALSPGEYADFQDYLGRLGIRIARQCREVVQHYPDIDVRELPCPAGGGMGSLPVDADTEKTPKEQVAELDASLAAGLSEFDEMLLREQQSIAAKAQRSSAAGTGDAGGGSGQGEGRPAEYAAGAEEDSGKVQWEDGRDAGQATRGEAPGAPPGRPGQQRDGTPRTDIPDGGDDDVVARQLREAAEKEKDPRLKEKLWDEYRRYKASTG